MQTIHLLNKRNKIWGIREENYSEVAYEREKKLRLYEKLRKEGSSEATILEALGVSRANLYRWKRRYKRDGLVGLESRSKRPNKVRSREWKPHLIDEVLKIRHQNPLYGKQKIAVILKRDRNATASVSTIGRIISDQIKRDRIKPAAFYYAKKRVKPRLFNNHAKRWNRSMKAKNPGEYVQIDHMSVFVAAGFTVKHFQAICPATKIVVEQAYSSATSCVASRFLDHVRTQFPFPIKSVQVDGGSEFMGEFEANCQEYDIPLYVLPPKSPECNGGVERANGSAKFEFYLFYEGPSNLFNLRQGLQRYVRKYNSFRPHQSLHYLTPLEYYSQLRGQSHM